MECILPLAGPFDEILTHILKTYISSLHNAISRLPIHLAADTDDGVHLNFFLLSIEFLQEQRTMSHLCALLATTYIWADSLYASSDAMVGCTYHDQFIHFLWSE